MRFPRAAGILLHPTSLPGPCGIGDLGAEAYRFLDFLSETRMRYWQMLPLGPTGYGESPYQCLSAFAGNPLLIEVPGCAGEFPADHVDFAAVMPHKLAALRTAVDAAPADDALRAFCAAEAWWLDDFALFMALKEAHGGVAWTDWAPPLARRDRAALAEARTTYAGRSRATRRSSFASSRSSVR